MKSLKNYFFFLLVANQVLAKKCNENGKKEGKQNVKEGRQAGRLFNNFIVFRKVINKQFKLVYYLKQTPENRKLK